MGLLALFKKRRRKKKHLSAPAGGNFSGCFFDNTSDSLVLIGTVKSKEQFDICLSEKFYYIPLKYLKEAGFQTKKDFYRIKYVSLYQSIAQYKNNSGIRYIGEVLNYSVVKREEITEIPKQSKALYIRFVVSEWKEKHEKIKVSEIGVYPFMIVPFGVFKSAKETAELTILAPQDRELYRMIRCIATDINMNSFSFGEYTFFDYNDNLVIYYGDKCMLQLPMEVIREIPYSGYETVKEAMKIDFKE